MRPKSLLEDVLVTPAATSDGGIHDVPNRKLRRTPRFVLRVRPPPNLQDALLSHVYCGPKFRNAHSSSFPGPSPCQGGPIGWAGSQPEPPQPPVRCHKPSDRAPFLLASIGDAPSFAGLATERLPDCLCSDCVCALPAAVGACAGAAAAGAGAQPARKKPRFRQARTLRSLALGSC